MQSDIPLLATPPQWSLTLGVCGRVLIYLAILSFVVSALGWILSPKAEWLKRVGKIGFTTGSISLFGAFLVLATLFAANRFEYSYVSGHGEAGNPLQYRIAGIWAGQQGSFLLWACTSALFGLLAVRGTGDYRRWFTVVYSVFLGSIAGILAYETPFALNTFAGMVVAPETGIGLSPALQNYWVVIHPPTIFLGFGALTVLGAYAFAAMCSNRLQEWVPMVRPWAILAMTLVGVGLCMGGFWAYETLGWGGFWMWDPVENVSFVPWIFCAAFVHGLMVQTARKRWTMTNLLLGGLPFMLFVYGTFLTRSGALSDTSVHSFAEMDNFAHKLLLGFMIGSLIGFLALWSYRLMQFRKVGLEPDSPPDSLNREGFYRTGTLLLSMTGLATAIGMSVPMFTSLTGKKPQVVQEAMYHRVLVWMYVPLMIVMAIAPLIPWRGVAAKEFLKRLYGIFCVTLVLVGFSMLAISLSGWTRNATVFDPIAMPFGMKIGAVTWSLILVSLSSFIVVANGWRIAELFKRSKMSAAAFLSHVAVAVLMAGLIVSRGLERKVQLMIQEGTPSLGLGYVINYKGRTGDLSDRANKLVFELEKGNDKWTASPSLYYASSPDGRENPVVWPHIEHRPFYDLYFALHPIVKEATDVINLKPGESKEMQGFNVKYETMTMDGQPGQSGTSFGAHLDISAQGQTIHVEPKMQIGAGGPQEIPVPVSPEYQITLKGINAADKSVSLQLLFTRPIYPVELFFKPMTGLVWFGTFLLGLSGIIAAWYRRTPKALAAKGAQTEDEQPRDRIPVGAKK